MGKVQRKSDICHNCETPIGDWNYCPTCGQKNTNKHVTLKVLIEDLLGDYFTFDSKFFKSFIPLLKMPGYLTNEYIEGKRTNYILPMRLFVFTSALFFFTMALNSNSESTINSLEKKHIPNQKDTLYTITEKSSSAEPFDKMMLAEELYYKFELSSKETNDAEEKADFVRFIKDQYPEMTDKKVNFLTYYLNNRFSLEKLDQDELQEVKKSGVMKMKIDGTGVGRNAQDSLKNVLGRFSGFGIIPANDSLFKLLNDNYLVVLRDKEGKIISGDKRDTTNFWGRFQIKVDKINSAQGLGWDLFKKELLNQTPKLVFFLLPVFALLLKLVYVRNKILYIKHLVFSLHIHSVFFIYMILPFFIDVWWIYLTAAIIYYVYLFFALKKVYTQSKIKTFVKLNLLLFLYFWPLIFGTVGLAIYTINSMV